MMPNFTLAIPEIFVLTMGCVALLAEVFAGKRFKQLTYSVVQLTLIVAAVLTWQLWGHPRAVTFSGLFLHDNLSVLLKEFIYLSAFLAFLYSRTYLEEFDMRKGEYYSLGLFSVLGMMVLVSGNHFITLFLGLELFSLPIYAMVALRRNQARCVEAAIKYFVMGALASGILLYGFSMLFGATHAMDITGIVQAMTTLSTGSSSMVLVFGLVFIVVGVCFKLGAAPFHMWVPDVYEGAPSVATLFLSTVPKIAALALMSRLLVEALPSIQIHWQQMLIVVSVLSMGLGNLAAIVQTNIKRMLAYSSIAHMGYMLLGFVAGNQNGYASSVFYMLTYVLMTLGAFGVIVLLSRQGVEIENLDDFKGLMHRSTWLAFMMMIIMFSMAGIPPLVGFMAKLSVLEALIGQGFIGLAAVALLFAIIGAYYYIRVIKLMYFEDTDIKAPIVCSFDVRAVLTLNSVAILFLGVFPGALLSLCHSVF